MNIAIYRSRTYHARRRLLC